MTVDHNLPGETFANAVSKQSDEITRLQKLCDALITRISNPEINNFMEGVAIEAAHQVERWGEEHDADKTFEQWTALLVRLLGKFVDANWNRDRDKALHHLITIAAVCSNAHRQMVKLKLAVEEGSKPGP
jgi:hypothetical protein